VFGTEADVKLEKRHIVDAFRGRLKSAAGFKFVPDPVPMRNSANADVYYLFFASQQGWQWLCSLPLAPGAPAALHVVVGLSNGGFAVVGTGRIGQKRLELLDSQCRTIEQVDLKGLGGYGAALAATEGCLYPGTGSSVVLKLRLR